MNVGIFTDCYRPTKNGVVTSIVHLKEGLERRGHKVILFTVKTPQHDERDSTVYRFPSLPFNSDIDIRLGVIRQKAVNAIVRHEQIDLIHTHTEFSLGWAAKRAAQSMRLPLIHTAHTMYEAYRHYLFWGKLLSPRMIQRAFRRFLYHYHVVVCPSKKAQQYFTAFLPALRTVVIANGVCQSRFHPCRLQEEKDRARRDALGIDPADRVILYVGRMAKEKRALELLDVLTPLLQKSPQYKAMFVGGGPLYQHMIDVAGKNNVGQQVIFTGYVNWERIDKLYSIADIFVTASLSEVHPMTVIEASMSGLPIVARRDGSYEDLIEDKYNGYLADSDRQIVERVSELLGDEMTLRQFSKNGLIVSEKFTTEIHAEHVEFLYHQVMNDPSLLTA
jgi:1,2-diacylglycerol 3-alpha-glucosyltransferase